MKDKRVRRLAKKKTCKMVYYLTQIVLAKIAGNCKPFGQVRDIRSFPQRRRRVDRQVSWDKTFFSGALS
ncbi:MAG: hypothetical protein GY874_07390 [Desulfobacteraceae bacterium]|nr:hypothetical protein [Desulfobacteraceae bacterium]